MTLEELNRFMAEAFDDQRSYVFEALEPDRLQARQPVTSLMLRPGGTVSGPTLMALADAAAYGLILAHIGPVALAVTSSLNMTFLRKPQPEDVVAEARFLKLGRKLAVVDVRLQSAGDPVTVAQAVVTYAIPSSEWATPDA